MPNSSLKRSANGRPHNPLMPASTTPSITLCDVQVKFTGSRLPLPCLGPLLYEWRVYRGEVLTCLYIGLAKDGQHRPFNMYRKVVCELRANRTAGATPGTHPGPTGMTPYFPRNPWGFRWIHHELESVAHRISNGNAGNERIELRFIANDLPVKALGKLERLRINQAKRQFLGQSVLANDRQSIGTRFKKNLPGLDSAWT